MDMSNSAGTQKLEPGSSTTSPGNDNTITNVVNCDSIKLNSEQKKSLGNRKICLKICLKRTQLGNSNYTMIEHITNMEVRVETK